VEKLLKIPLVFLFIASCIGLFLRYQLIAPVDGIVYAYVLHAHSHVMFLGWVFNVLIIAFTMEFAEVKGFKFLFWFLQFCVVGMLVSFPFQGYGGFSITFSALHTFAALTFIIKFFRSNKSNSTIALIIAKTALLYFALSSIGPFFLGYLKANRLDHLDLYRNSIYFYLHFQYNGFFLLGVLGLLVKFINEVVPEKYDRAIKNGSYLHIFCCLPAYALSTLWAQPPVIFNVIGFLSALGQLVGLWFFVSPIRDFISKASFTRTEKLLFSISFAALALKSVLQALSAFPAAALFANEFRSIVIAYLHLVLLGSISLFLIAWLIRKQVIESSLLGVWLLLSGFIGSQIVLVISPWNGVFFQLSPSASGSIMFFFSILMVCGLGIIISTSKNLMQISPSIPVGKT
jgi:hypothetical protein